MGGSGLWYALSFVMRNRNYLVGVVFAALLCTGLYTWVRQERRATVGSSPVAGNRKIDPFPSRVPSPSPSVPLLSAVSSITARQAAPAAPSAIVQFHGWAERYAAADPTRRVGMLDEGLHAAEARKSEFLALMTQQPARAIEEALSYGLRKELPRDFENLVERRVSGSGNLLVMGVAPNEDGSPVRDPIRRSVELNGARYQAIVYGRRRLETTQYGIPIHGVALSGLVALSDQPARRIDSDEASDLIAAKKIPADPICSVSGASASVNGAPLFMDLGGQYFPLCSAAHSARLNKTFLAGLQKTFQLPDGAGSTNIFPGKLARKVKVTQGRLSVLFMRIAFVDDPREPISEDAAYRLMNEVNDYYRTASYNLVQMVPTVTPLLILPKPLGYYGPSGGPGEMLEDARKAAREAGFEFTDYDLDVVGHINVPFEGWNWCGLGYVGARGSWIQCFTPKVVAHELGHNFGLLHANSTFTKYAKGIPNLADDVKAIDLDGVYGHDTILGNTYFVDPTAGTNYDKEYGNPNDWMGSGDGLNGQFSSLMKWWLHWISPEHVAAPSKNGTNRIYAFDGTRVLPDRQYALALEKDHDFNTTIRRFYWIDHRQQFPNNPWLANGVSVYWTPWDGTDGSAQLLDMTPGSKKAMEDAALVVGHTFSDPEIGLHITPVARGGVPPEEWVDVVVNFGQFPSNRPPTFTLHANKLILAPGEAVEFSAQDVADADGDGVVFRWDFSDETFGPNSATVTKSFGQSGEYAVRCEVSDMKGGKTSAHVFVIVGTGGPRRIEGQVVDQDGRPVADVRVAAIGSDQRVAFTDSEGRYILTGSTNSSVTNVAFLYGYESSPLSFNNPAPAESMDGTQYDHLAIALPKVSVVVATNADERGLRAGIFRLTRTGSTNDALAVSFRLYGTATPGEDFADIGTGIVFGPGTNTIDLPIVPSADGVSEGRETVTLQLLIQTNLDRFFNVVTNDGTNDILLAMTNSWAVPGWEVRSVNRTLTWYQTHPQYVLGKAAATLSLFDDSSPPIPNITALIYDETGLESSEDDAVVLLSRDASFDSTLKVNYTIGGTASNGIDYETLSGVATFEAGDRTALIIIRALDDLFVEGDETVTITVAAGAGYAAAGGSATVILVDDDLTSVTVNASTQVTSEASGREPGRFVISRSGDLSTSLQVNYLLAGTATNGVDFATLPGFVVIPAGEDSVSIDCLALADGLTEPAESVVLQLASSTAYNVSAPAAATVWIEDESIPMVTLTPAGANALVEGGTAVQYTVTRFGGSPGPLTVYFSVSGVAIPNTDYAAIGNSVFLPRGATSATINLQPVEDAYIEFADYLTLSLTPGTGYYIGSPNSARVPIGDNDGTSGFPLVEFVTLGSSVRESYGDTPWFIPVHLSGKPDKGAVPVIVEYEVRAGSAVLGSNYLFADYPLLSKGWLAFDYDAPNSTRIVMHTNIAVSILDNSNREPDRFLLIGLQYPTLIITNITQRTNPPVAPATQPTVADVTNFTIFPTNFALGAKQFHRLTILDDDAGTVGVDVAKANAYEEGKVAGQFVFVRSGPLDRALTAHVSYSGTAVQGNDYLALPSQVTIPAGTNAAYLNVFPVDDQTPEPTETIGITLDFVSGGLVNAEHSHAELNLVDNDGTMEFTAASFQVSERDGHIDVPVRRSGDITHAQSVSYHLQPGTATPGSDYEATDGVLTFLPGETQKSIPVQLVDDTLPEVTETLFLSLSNPFSGTPLSGQSVATLSILDDDIGFLFATNTFVVSESQSNVSITVLRVGDTSVVSHVRVVATNGTATANVDFQPLDQLVEFPVGASTVSVSLRVLDDQLVEGDEDVALNLIRVNGEGDVDLSPTSLIIRDDDSTLDFVSGKVRVYENSGYALLTVRRLGGVLNAVSASYKTVNGSATGGADFTPTSGSVSFLGDRYELATNGSGELIFLAGESRASIAVPILDDAIGEPSKSFSVVLSAPKIIGAAKPAGTVALGTNAIVVVTLLDDELPGNSDQQYASELALNGSVNAIAFQPSGRAVFGGEFTEVNDFTFNHIARLTLHGDLDIGFDPGIGSDGAVLALSPLPGGRVLLGGTFSRVGGSPRAGLARIDSDGEVDLGFGSAAKPNGAVRALALEEGEFILIGGDFTTVGGGPHSRLARLDGSGLVDAAFAPNIRGDVRAVVVQPNGKILVGGGFTNVNTTKVFGLVRLNADGSIDNSFQTGTGFLGSVNAIALQPDGGILVGGLFSRYNNTPVNNLLRLTASGSIDDTFNAGSGPDAAIRAMGIHGSGHIYIGGDFIEFDGTARSHFARLRQNGSLDETFAVGEGADGVVRTLVVLENSSVLIGGEFTHVNGNPRSHIAKIHGDEKLSVAGVEFVSALTRVDEGVGTVTLTLRRTGDPGVSFSAHVTTVAQGSTATAGSDYVADNATLLFPVGVNTRTFGVQIQDDSQVEDLESFVIKIDFASDGIDLGGLVTSTVQIQDNEVSVGFAESAFSIDEAAANASVTVVRQGSINGSSSVLLTTLDGSAVAGQDYTSVSTVVTFLGTETTKTVLIPILEDTVREPLESFTVNLSSPSEGLQIRRASAAVNIVDDDNDKLTLVASSLLSDASNNGVIETGEQVTVSIALRNVGTADATNVVAVLLATNTIIPVGGVQNYGAMKGDGDPVSRSFTFSSSAASGTTVNLLLRLQDGLRDLGTVVVPIPLGEQAVSFRSGASITVNDVAKASPYPSVINVSGVAGTPTRVTVTLDGFSHGSPADVDMLLVAPDGDKTVLFSDAGGFSRVNDLVITLDDTAARSLPANTPLSSGVFRPSNYNALDAFEAPAPAGPYPKSDLHFTMPDANGAWSLYIVDDTREDSGLIQNGWKLNLYTSGRIPPVTDVGVALSSATNSVTVGQNVFYTLRVVNNGPADASAIVVHQDLPANAAFVSASGGSTFSGGRITINLPVLSVGSSAEFQVVLRATEVGTLTTTASVSTSVHDIFAANNFSSRTVAVNAVITAVPLSITAGVQNIVLSWPKNGSGVLEATPSLTGSVWVPVAGTPNSVGPIWTITLPATTSVRFYRLRTP